MNSHDIEKALEHIDQLILLLDDLDDYSPLVKLSTKLLLKLKALK